MELIYTHSECNWVIHIVSVIGLYTQWMVNFTLVAEPARITLTIPFALDVPILENFAATSDFDRFQLIKYFFQVCLE